MAYSECRSVEHEAGHGVLTPSAHRRRSVGNWADFKFQSRVGLDDGQFASIGLCSDSVPQSGQIRTHTTSGNDFVASHSHNYSPDPHHPVYPQLPSLFQGSRPCMHASDRSSIQYLPHGFSPSNEIYPPSGPQTRPTLTWSGSFDVTHFIPEKGLPVTPLQVYLRAHEELNVPPNLRFFIMFEEKKCLAALMKLRRQSPYFEYCLSTPIPSPDNPASPNTVPIFLTLEDPAGQRVSEAAIGNFTYSYTEDCHAQIRKRRASDDSTDTESTPLKRPKLETAQSVAARMRFPHNESPCLPSPAWTQQDYTPKEFQSYLNSTYDSSSYPEQAYFTPDDFTRQDYSPALYHGLECSALTPFTRSISMYGAYTPLTSIYSSPAGTTSRSMSKPRPVTESSVAPFQRSLLHATSTHAAQARCHSDPPRIRPTNSTNTYTKMKLELAVEGDLDSMLDNWTEEEWMSKRRLVILEKSQSANILSISFKAVAPEQRTPGSICVSCIWWEEKQEAYITSVDTIALAESLCGKKFNVPEKNRIRRNLEGLKPVTITKDKKESEEFFKVIMGFVNPKPRNIEKHIKVLKWKNLTAALKKVVPKYADSYDASAAADAAAATGNFRTMGCDGSELYDELDATLSPRSAASYSPCMSSTHGKAAAAAATATHASFSQSHSHSHLHSHFPNSDAAAVQVGIQGGGGAGAESLGNHRPEVRLAALPSMQPDAALYLDDWQSPDQSDDAFHYPWTSASASAPYFDPGPMVTAAASHAHYDQRTALLECGNVFGSQTPRPSHALDGGR